MLTYTNYTDDENDTNEAVVEWFVYDGNRIALTFDGFGNQINQANNF